MIQVCKNLFVGDQSAFIKLCQDQQIKNPQSTDQLKGWAVVHACKEPYHRQAVGYTSKAAPKDHEYLFAKRGNRLMLNLVDADDPKYISPDLILAAFSFIADHIAHRKVLIHCNQGHSRAPSIALGYLIVTGRIKNHSFEEAEAEFKSLYPAYAPAKGVREFFRTHS